MSKVVLALVNDLFFYSKIRQAALQQGLTLEPAEPERLAEAVAAKAPGAVLLELGSGMDAALQAVRAVKDDPATAATRVVAFGSHVQTEVLEAARQAGCDEVLARSEFTARLPELLRS